MVIRMLTWSVLAFVSVSVCVFTGSRVAEMQRQCGLLRRDVGLARGEEEALRRRVTQERHNRAIGLLAPLRRPITPELPTIFRRVPADVRLREMTITPEAWQLTGQRYTPTGDSEVEPYQLHLTRVVESGSE